MWINGKETVSEGETAHFNGRVQFHQSIRHIKWQKYQYNEYIDIDIHNQKYKGSKNDLGNPKLEVHNAGGQDELQYRLEVKTKSFTCHSNEIALKVLCVRG